MQPTEGGPVKIGFTDNLAARHKQLESHYGRPLAILTTMPGDMGREAEIHARFAHLRYDAPDRRGRRLEQFRPAAELMEFIGRPLLVDLNPDTVEALKPSDPVRKVVFQMKGSEEWKGWLDDLAKQLRMPTSAVVDNALVMYAKAQGFNREAPER